jgi:hypothetical protein
MLEFEKYYKSYKFNFSPSDIVEKKNNRYLSIDRDGLMLIRDFCNPDSVPVDIDDYYSDDEISELNDNIIKNSKSLNANIDFSKYSQNQSAILVGSGINKNETELLDKNQYLVVGINKSLIKCKDKLSVYISLNPYESSVNLIPKDFRNEWPEGVFSYKVHPKFLRFYKGSKAGFNLPRFKNSNGPINIHKHHTFLEDHRCPAFTALSFIFNTGVRRIVLIGIENYLKEERPGTIYIKENVYMYPQQLIETSIISAAAYWLHNFGISVYTTNEDIDFIEHIQKFGDD